MAYYAGTNNRSQWTGVSLAQIASDIVVRNCTATATTGTGRLRNASVIRNLQAGGIIGGTAAVNYSCAYKNVLDAVTELAIAGNFDFDILRVGGSPNILSFQEYAGQLGADKHATVIFDMALDNVVAASLDGGRLREKTVAIVGGVGEGSSRTISIRTGVNQSASNDYEIFLDARSNDSTELPTLGDAKLAELQARAGIDIDIISSEGVVYRRDYGLGDLVTVSFDNVQETKKINVIEVTFDQSQEVKVRVEFVDP